MKESYDEILARYAGPKPYAGLGNEAGVATAGVQPGQVTELRNEYLSSVCRHTRVTGRQHRGDRHGKIILGHGGVKEPWHGWILQTREPGDPASLSEEVTDSGLKTFKRAQQA
jgi:hypothetical protein